MTRGRQALALAAWLGTAACVRERVVLLPGEAGHPVGALAVINEDGSDRGVLASAYSDVGLSGRRGAVKARAAAPAKVETRYGRLVADLPPPPFSTRVPFDFGTAATGADAQAVLKQLFDEIGRRPGAQVQVIGHTDTVDSDALNDELSRQRAEAVRDHLVASGVPGDQIRVSWVGKREPIRNLGDNVRDDENRKAEVLVR